MDYVVGKGAFVVNDQGSFPEAIMNGLTARLADSVENNVTSTVFLDIFFAFLYVYIHAAA